jgi:hypothetical protein
MNEQPKIGDKVILTKPHGWYGQIGTYIADRETPFGIDHVVRIDSGGECYVSTDNQWRKMDENAQNQ